MNDAEIRANLVHGDGPFKIVFDIEEMRPGCSLLQVLGGSPGIEHAFEPSTWLLSPTPTMGLYTVTKGELVILIRKVHAFHLGEKT